MFIQNRNVRFGQAEGLRLAMRLPARTAAALALLLGMILAASPSFAQSPAVTDIFSYAETSDTGDHLCKDAAVVDGVCRLTIPTREQVGGSDVAAVIANTGDPAATDPTTVTLTIPVELTLDGVLDTNLDLPSGANQNPPAMDASPVLAQLNGALAVIHGSQATADAALTLTITGNIITQSQVEEFFGMTFPLTAPRGVDVRVESDADVTVDNQGIVLSHEDSIRLLSTARSAADVTVRNSGTIADRGRRNSDGSLREDTLLPRDSSVGSGIQVVAAGTGDITIENTGTIRKNGNAIEVRHWGTAGDVRVSAGGVVESRSEFGLRVELVTTSSNTHADLYAAQGNRALGAHNTVSRIWVQVEEGARVSGAENAILVEAPGAAGLATTCALPSRDPAAPRYRSCVAVLGTVEGGTGGPAPAAIRIVGGGVLAIGPQGRVATTDSANPAVLFRNHVDDSGDAPAAVLYLIQNEMAGEIDGDISIPESADRQFLAWALPHDLGVTELLAAIEEFQRGERTAEELQGLLGRIRQADLSEEDIVLTSGLYDVTWSYDFDTNDFSETGRTLAQRARVYEALPSVLLSANRPLAHDDRWSAPRADGWWMWAEVASGNWEADASAVGDTSLANGEYDYDRYAAEIGHDWAVNKNAVVGLAAHYRDIDADVDGGGSIDADGYGVGVSARINGEKTYLALQSSATWYEVDLSNPQSGALGDDVDGFGWSAGAEVGYRMEHGEWIVTPRAGLTYSEVDLDSFRGPGGRVSLEDGESMLGRAGVRAQRGDLYAAVDVEHEFSDDDRRVESRGTEAAVLESEAEDTRVRVTAGGIHEWGEGRYSLHARLNYAASDGSNDEFGGSLTLQGRF